ncbi:oligopeptide transporter [Rhizoclosmatium globosum]|uniref:Oligopeptide transporter n=1 Tax=Rhizoclosmatium globosum TaxID=329046 RepID=A0A1Y2C2K3_9FUNG|nr:oligopeptide transporter [Rhizoclosmatium globosum]|eukprot:ORY41249.1 oligopeptide transporter [Rhizoclosmatium globosum]
MVDDFGFGAVAKIVSTEDDPTLPLLTFRFFVLSTILSPQTLTISALFHQLASYIGGLFMAWALPKGILNPGPFNIKEHVLISTTASTASASALATGLIASENLYFNKDLGYGAVMWLYQKRCLTLQSPKIVKSIALILCSQLIGYGLAGIYRAILVYPARSYYPSKLSSIALFETLHRSKTHSQKYIRFFSIVFCAIFLWEWIPQFVAPTLVGLSVFCLANQSSQTFTILFGGINSNEGLGLFSICLDWLYISSDPLTLPWSTQVNQMIGLLGCIAAMLGFYYGNVWNSLALPFMGQGIFTESGDIYNQSLILDATGNLNLTAYEEYGQPYFAAITHTLLWNSKEIWDAVKGVPMFGNTDGKSVSSDETAVAENIHYYMMQKTYAEVPQWWYLLLLVISCACAIVVNQAVESGLDWWAFLIAVGLAAFLTLAIGFLFSTTGFNLPTQPFVQLIGGLVKPQNATANMYFTLYGFNTTQQAMNLLMDLKVGQYMKIPARTMFLSQIMGTVIGGVSNYFITNLIVTTQRDVLLTTNGNDIWSGQQVQNYNAQAVTWGALGKQLFGAGAYYQWIPYSFLFGLIAPIPTYVLHQYFPRYGFNYINTAIISWWIGYMTNGINSNLFMYVVLGVVSQFYLRKYFSSWFNQYNYLLAAALDGGTQVAVFIMTFALFGAGGTVVEMPTWALNPDTSNGGFSDYCGMGLANSNTSISTAS